MIDHVWSVLCTNVVIDRDTGNLSLIETIEQWNISTSSELPIVIGNPIFLVTMWSRSDYDTPVLGRAKISLVSPSGLVRDMPEYEINMNTSRRLRARNGIQGVEIIEEGKYKFQVVLIDKGDDSEPEVVASIPLEVVIQEGNEPS